MERASRASQQAEKRTSIEAQSLGQIDQKIGDRKSKNFSTFFSKNQTSAEFKSSTSPSVDKLELELKQNLTSRQKIQNLERIKDPDSGRKPTTT